jgi:hypothetical protein
VKALHFHTYFLFPFSVDTDAVQARHSTIWSKDRPWLNGLDEWIMAESSGELVERLGRWKRQPYTRFDLNSQAYQDMVFFHPFMRRAFFDVQTAEGTSEESMVRCYVIPVPDGAKLWFEAHGVHGRSGSIEVTDLRLFMFANGIGILSFGVEASDVPMGHVLWINESLRKVYPSSGRQIEEERSPCDLAVVLEQGEFRKTVVRDTETFRRGEMKGVLPPLVSTITEPLYFLDYTIGEFEPVLDERMVVYSYVAIDPSTVPDNFKESEDYQFLLSRILYVDWEGDNYRYSPKFVRRALDRQLYTRWDHQGTYYGFTSYSSIAVTLGTIRRGEGAGPLVHMMFETRHYMMTLVALFYRASLLDFSERTALVSKTLYLDRRDGELAVENISICAELNAEFRHFSSHWYFTELANKDEETEHFDMQCQQYRTEEMLKEVADELEALNASLHTYYQFRNTEALNRLGMLSLILGAGAVITGFFGMNFQIGPFAGTLLAGHPGSAWTPYLAIGAATLIAFGAMLFGIFLIASNWSDYRDTLLPRRWRATRTRQSVSKRDSNIS